MILNSFAAFIAGHKKAMVFNHGCEKGFLRRIGVCNGWVGFKFRGASASRMAFALLTVDYG